MSTPEKRIERTYDAPTIQRALIALVAANGNSRKASAALAEDGVTVPHQTLDEWRRLRHVEEYERLREKMLPEIRKRQADAHRALEIRQLEASLEGTDLIHQRLGSMENKDLINAVGKLDIGSGIHAEKAELLNDRPTSRPMRSADEILRKLRARRVLADGTEEEVVAEEAVPSEHAAVPALQPDQGS